MLGLKLNHVSKRGHSPQRAGNESIRLNIVNIMVADVISKHDIDSIE